MLLVDDDADVRRVEQLHLARLGALVETATNALEALRMLMHRDYDVLLVDLVMPEMSGLDFIREVLALWPWLGIVVMTGFPEQEEEALAWVRSHHVGEVLVKPLDHAALKEAVLRGAMAKKQRVVINEPLPVDRLQRQISSLRMCLEKVLSTDNLRDSFHHLAEGLGLLFTSSVVGIFFASDENSVLVLNTLLPVTSAFLDKLRDDMIKHFEILSGQSVARATIALVREGLPPESSAPDACEHAFSIPLVMDHRVRGIITLASAYSNALAPFDMAFFYHAAAQIGTVLVALNRIREFALRDVLTGLLNRRGMKQHMEWAWEACKRRRTPLSVVIIDLDHFKTLNDTHGHLIGDKLLEECSNLIRAEVRSSDVVARFGGDEVVVALLDLGEDYAAAFCSRLLARIREHVFCADTHQLRFTASAGVASVIPGQETAPKGLGTLLAHADRALYEAKRAGRNRFHIWNAVRRTAPGELRPSVAPVATQLQAGASGGQLLVVDDEAVILTWVCRVLDSAGYATYPAKSFAEAAARIQGEEEPVDVLLTDVLLPDGSGMELIRMAKKRNDPPVCLVMTGHLLKESGVAALREGVFDILEKPFLEEQLVMAVRRAMEHRHLQQANFHYQAHLEDLVEERGEALQATLGELRDSYQFVLRALASMLDARERQTGQHSLRVAELSRTLARKFGLPERDCQDIYEGALLHDIGKIGVPDAILLKEGPLTDEEWSVMKQHPRIGYNVIRSGKFLQKAADIVYCHQEHYDGTGYPRGLKGEDIPLGARIFAVADAYDAMRSRRTYKEPLSASETIARILEQRGRQFDPVVVDVLVRCQAEIEAIGKWDYVMSSVST